MAVAGLRPGMMPGWDRGLPGDRQVACRAAVGGIAALILTLTLALAIAPPLSAATYQVLKTFTGSDGAGPVGGLVLSDSTLYGTTSAGGTWGDGTVYKVNADGTGYQVLVNFNGRDWGSPQAGLVLAGSTLCCLARAAPRSW